MKRIILSILLGIAGMAVCSCSQDISEYDREKEDTFRFTFTVNGIGSEIKTRATVIATEAEQKVNTLHLFFFKESDDKSGELVKCVTLDSGLEMSVEQKLSDSDISVSEGYNIVAVANIEDRLYISGPVSEWISQWSGATERYFSENVIASITFCDRIEPGKIPMSGYAVKKSGDNKINVALTRVAARLDVINNAAGYNLQSASVWNAYYRSSLTGEAVMDYSQTIGLRTKDFYGSYNIVDNSLASELYAFENQVISPENGDRHTTCIIVGLEKQGGTRYYRVNIHPSGSPQNLKRNNSYTITINGVAGEGYDDEEKAYAGKTNELIYSINYWDLDDNGLIVQDINSILAIPTKTVRIGHQGTTNAYTITTFSRLENPAPLIIKNQTYQPADGSITATLSGNTLYITAGTLPAGEPDRTGIITLTYADLEASVNVIQSSSVDKFLTVTLEDDFVPMLGASGGSFSEFVFVDASGPWTATLYGSTPPEFSLEANGYTGSLQSGNLTHPRFRVHTLDKNAGPDENKCFVLISLDDDPLNYVSVVSLSQKVAGSILVTPSIEEMTFDGAGNLTSPAKNKIEVRSASNDFLRNVDVGGINNFHVVPDYEASDNVTSGSITITAKGENTTGGTLSDILTIKDAGGGEINIKLSQSSLGLYLDPQSPSTTVPAAGGRTEWITVNTGSDRTTYSLDVVTVGNVYNHEAYIEFDDNSASLSNKPMDTKFRVVFPKVYYPNREQNISASIMVKVDDSSLQRQITASQVPLTPKPVKAAQMFLDLRGWVTTSGGGGTYNMNYVRTLHNTALFGPSGVVKTPGAFTIAVTNWAGVAANLTDIASDITMFNAQSIGTGTDANTARAANYIKSWLDNNEGMLVINDDYHIEAAFNQGRLYDVLGHKSGSRSSSGNIHLLTSADVVNRRAYIYIVGGEGPFGKVEDPSQVYANAFDAERQTLSYGDGYPATGVPLLVDGGNNVSLMVDPGNRVAFNGEMQVLHTENSRFNLPIGSLPGNDATRFMANYVAFIYNVAMYGTHFSDMLVDYAPGDQNAVPAPWDPVWNTPR